MAIPNRLLFIWFGREFPFANLLALRSARNHCRPEQILLLAEHPDLVREQLGVDAAWPELEILPATAEWFEGLPEGGAAAKAFGQSSQAAAKANLLRLAALYRHGGVYLDFDTITVRDLAPLRRQQGFCGLERVVFPYSFRRCANPVKWVPAALLLGLRETCARLPAGWKAFRRFEGLYSLAANNAVLGAEPGNALLGKCFRMIAAMPVEDRLRRFRLGTHLLQEALEGEPDLGADAGNTGNSFSVLPPEAFFPLGPEISNHWFRPGTAASLPAMLSEGTFVVHWYNSVEPRYLKQTLTPELLERLGDSAFAELTRLHCASRAEPTVSKSPA